MEEKNIRQYAKLMQEYDLTCLEITEDNSVIHLERANKSAAFAPNEYPDKNREPVYPQGGEQDINEGYTDVLSPMVGVFYCAPEENARPFVSVGDKVKKGDTLCIIEAMKLMNEITAEQDGTIAEVCAGNGQVVDYGHVLFRMKKEL